MTAAETEVASKRARSEDETESNTKLSRLDDDSLAARMRLEAEKEPILMPSLDRFVGQSKRYPEVMKMLQKLISVFWQPSTISLKDDVVEFPQLSNKEQNVLKLVHGFFASSDGIVNENIDMNFLSRIQTPEHRAFWEFQQGNECVHKLTYGDILIAIVPDQMELAKLFNSIETHPIIKKKAEFAFKYMAKGVPFADQLLAFACIEGIQFCASFLIIFYFKSRGLMKGISQANEYIARDESLHVNFATYTYFYNLEVKSEREEEIISEATELELEFARDILGDDGLFNFKTEDVCDYIKFVADRLGKDVGREPLYGTKNKFSFMEMIGISPRTNTFERRGTDYIGKGAVVYDGKLKLDDNF